MVTLEEELARVEDLRKDLSAEIVIQKEEGHYENRNPSGTCSHKHYGGGDSVGYWFTCEECDGDVRTVDKPKIAEPDTKKRELARQILQQIYDSSDWFSAKYISGEILEDKTLNEKCNSWLNELERTLNATKLEVQYKRLEANWRNVTSDTYEPVYENVPVGEIEVPDYEKRIVATKDITKLYKFALRKLYRDSDHIRKLLKRVYRTNKVKDVRLETGRTLGYSGIRVRIHELFK